MAEAVPDTVRFYSRDGKTELVGYVFQPQTPGPYPAVVMMHGRSGPYSTLQLGVYSAENLTGRHRTWGKFWAKRGYLALHVDSYSTRGYPAGFPKHSYKTRPLEVSEQTVRPLDAYGALDYLRSRDDVVKDRIGLQGWSNGAMAALAAMAPNPPRVGPSLSNRVRLAKPTPATDFRAVLVQYPGCRIQEKQLDYVPYAPMLMLLAERDGEVSPAPCNRLVQAVQARGGTLEAILYEGAHHAYDDPGRTKQSHAPNKVALQDSLRRADKFFSRYLRP